MVRARHALPARPRGVCAMRDPPPTLGRPKWNAVVLVCKACSKRSKGPKHLKAKALTATNGIRCSKPSKNIARRVRSTAF